MVKQPIFQTAVFLRISRKLTSTMILPSLPAISLATDADRTLVQLTVTAFVIGLFIAKLFVLFKADQIGPKKSLLIILPFLPIGALISIVPHIGTILAGRILQGIGIGGATSLGIVLIKGATGKEEFKKKIALLGAIILWIPAIATLVGGFIQSSIGWQANFILLAVTAIFLFIACLIFIPNENKVANQFKNFGFDQFKKVFSKIAGDRVFVGYAIIYSSILSSSVVFYTITPFLFIHELKVAPHEYALALLPYFTGLFVGIIFSGKLREKLSFHSFMKLCHLIMLVSTIILGLSYFYPGNALAIIIISMGLAGLGIGPIAPIVESAVPTLFSNAPATATATLGITLSIVNILSAVVAAHIPSTTAGPLALLLLILIGLSTLSFIFILRAKDLARFTGE